MGGVISAFAAGFTHNSGVKSISASHQPEPFVCDANHGDDVISDVTTKGVPKTLVTGYYRIKAAHDDNTSAKLGHTFNAWLFSDMQHTFQPDASSNTYGVTLANVPATEHQKDNCYVWHVNVTSSTAFTMLNGQGTNGVKQYANATTRTDITSFTLSSGSDGCWMMNNMGLSNKDAAWTVKGTAVSSAEDTQSNPLLVLKLSNDQVCSHWNFEKIADDEQVYTVNITGGTSSTIVTRTSTNEVALNGGFFLGTSGTTLTADDFSVEPATIGVTKPTITIADDAINVVYSADADLARAEAERVLKIRGAGYPTENSAAYAALKNVIDNASATAEQLQTALTTYSQSTEIQMPEDGHTYVFTNIQLSGKKAYMSYTTDGVTMTERGETAASELPESAKFTCHTVDDGKYVFVNNAGLYLIWKGATGGYSSASYLNHYDATWTPMTVAKFQESSGSGSCDVCGAVSIGGHRGLTGDYVESNFVVNNSDFSFNAGSKGYNWYNSSCSTAFLLEEVDYENKVTFNNTGDAFTDVNYIATFSAPFPTVVPEGVSAYYVKRDDNVANVTMIPESQAVPANTGVLLTSTTGEAVYMAPAAAETSATIESNDLGNSAGAAKELAEGAGYILGNGNSGVAFYKAAAGTLPKNKAYLAVSGTDATVSSIRMVFGGTVEGIADAVSAPADSNAPMYDLTGRRVLNPVKGGVYIQNGLKHIVK